MARGFFAISLAVLFLATEVRSTFFNPLSKSKKICLQLVNGCRRPRPRPRPRPPPPTTTTTTTPVPCQTSPPNINGMSNCNIIFLLANLYGNPIPEDILLVVYSSVSVPGTEFIPLDGEPLPTCLNGTEPHIVSSVNATTMMRPAIVRNKGVLCSDIGKGHFK